MSTEPEAAVSQVEASKGSVLDMIEAAYPNPVTLDTMCRYIQESTEKNRPIENNDVKNALYLQ